MLHIGVDVHKKSLQICVLNEDGERVQNLRLDNTKESVTGYFGSIKEPAAVALEATHNWGMLYDLFCELGMDAHVCHSREAKLIGLARVKTDRIDAYKLARLQWSGMLPEAYVPDGACRELRELVRARASLTKLSTQLKNQVQAILKRNWVSCPYSDTFGKAGKEYLRGLKLKESYQLVIASKLTLLERIEYEKKLLEAEVKRRAHGDLRAMLLTTIPGVAEYTALVILSEIGDISRLYGLESLVKFAGFHPGESSSGDSTRRGRITKEGSVWLRWILVEAAQNTVRQEGKIRDLYLRVLEKKGHNKAIVAAAREMLVSIYFMLKRMEPYRPESGRKKIFSTSEAR